MVLVVSVFLMAGFFYFFVVGVHHGDRLLSRTAALAFLTSGAMAVVFFVRVVL